MTDSKSSYNKAIKEIREVRDNGYSHLEISGAGYENLEELPDEIKSLKDITSVVLDDTKIRNLSSLSELTKIEEISIKGTEVESLADIANLKNLHTLNISSTKVSDISILAGLPKIVRLRASYNKINDISVFKYLRELRSIRMDGTSIYDLSVFSEMDSVYDLDIDNTDVHDLSPLENHEELRQLWFSNTNVEDISVLSKLVNLEIIWMRGTPVSDITPLASLTKLSDIWLDRTKVTDISPLSSLSNLNELWLNNTKINDISPLSSLSELHSLFMEGVDVTDFSSLASLKSLRTLRLGNNKISNLAPLKNLSNLRDVTLNNTQVVDVVSLASLVNLKNLYIHKTKLRDISPLSALKELETVDLEETLVEDVSPLSACTSLRSIDLDDTKVHDLRPLKDLKKLGSDSSSIGVTYKNIPLLEKDYYLRELAEIEDNAERTQKTLSYLAELPAWPEPLEWQKSGEQPAPPLPDPAVPLILTEDGVSIRSTGLDANEAMDPIRGILHEELRDRVQDLIRISANLDDGLYREALRLQRLLETDVNELDALRVHLIVESLRRRIPVLEDHKDMDLTVALTAVVETGPGLTLDTKEVNLFIERQRKNREVRKEGAELESEIRLAERIGTSSLSAEELKALAVASAVANIDDQISGIRPTLTRNWVIYLGSNALIWASQGVVGNTGHQAVSWLVANSGDIIVMARYWGEPFMAWILPIIEKSNDLSRGLNYVREEAKERLNKRT